MSKMLELLRNTNQKELIKLLIRRDPISVSSINNLSRIKNYCSNISTIIDVGANAGQFAIASKLLFPDSKLYCFEPSPSIFNALTKSLTNYQNVELFNVGLGDVSKESSFYENSYDQISSFRKISSNNRNPKYRNSTCSIIKCKIAPLDEFQNKMQFNKNVLLKLDVQGYEDKVLLGAQKTLAKVDYIMIELSFEELYEKQKLFYEIDKLLNEYGYSFFAPLGYNLGAHNAIIEMDALYKKNNISVL